MTTDLGFIQYGAMAFMLTGWIGILAFAGLKGWNGWLSLKRAELDLAMRGQASTGASATLPAATRIDIADLKERIRKLEAIAAGIDV
jgi:hypothetical protein